MERSNKSTFYDFSIHVAKMLHRSEKGAQSVGFSR
jgi:hypothetical protein